MRIVKRIMTSSLTYFGIMLVMLFFFFCNMIVSLKAPNSHEHATVAYDYKFHFAIDLGDVGTGFTEEFLRGAREAADQLEVALEIANVNSSFSGENLDFLHWASYSQIDAVITAHLADQTPELEEWIAQSNLPVCTVGIEYPYPGFSYVGPDNYKIGYELAKKISEIRSGESVLIGLLYSRGEQLVENRRLRGFRDGAAECDNLYIIHEDYTEDSILSAMGTTESIVMQQDVNYIVCLSEVLTTGAIRGIVDLNKVHMIGLAGVGYPAEIEDYLDNEILEVAVDVNAYEIGRRAVQLAYYAKTKKNYSKRTHKEYVAYEILGD